jgi:hypothetical protein
MLSYAFCLCNQFRFVIFDGIIFHMLSAYLLEISFQCAESALKSVLGGLDNTYFVGNAPMAHMEDEQTGDSSVPSLKVLVVSPLEI